MCLAPSFRIVHRLACCCVRARLDGRKLLARLGKLFVELSTHCSDVVLQLTSSRNSLIFLKQQCAVLTDLLLFGTSSRCTLLVQRAFKLTVGGLERSFELAPLQCLLTCINISCVELALQLCDLCHVVRIGRLFFVLKGFRLPLTVEAQCGEIGALCGLQLLQLLLQTGHSLHDVQARHFLKLRVRHLQRFRRSLELVKSAGIALPAKECPSHPVIVPTFDHVPNDVSQVNQVPNLVPPLPKPATQSPAAQHFVEDRLHKHTLDLIGTT